MMLENNVILLSFVIIKDGTSQFIFMEMNIYSFNISINEKLLTYNGSSRFFFKWRISEKTFNCSSLNLPRNKSITEKDYS